MPVFLNLEKYQLAESLIKILGRSQDLRTQKFLIIALSSLASKNIIPVLEHWTEVDEKEIIFHAVMGLGNLSNELTPFVNWNKLSKFLNSEDAGIRQTVIYALANHGQVTYKEIIKLKLGDEDRGVRYAAASALLGWKDLSGAEIIREMLFLGFDEQDLRNFKISEIEGLKLMIFKLLLTNKIVFFHKDISDLLEQEKNLKIVAKGKEVLNLRESE